MNHPRGTVVRRRGYLENDSALLPVRVRGHGPGVILIPGGLETAADFTRLADRLAKSFTTFVVERRGRGASRHLAAQPSIDNEATDVIGVARAMGVRYMFGHSSGALISLQAAHLAPELIDSIAVYEPPLPTAGYQDQFDWAGEVAQLIREGRCSTALARMISAVFFNGALKRKPNIILRAAAAIALRWGRGTSGEALVDRLQAFTQDACIVDEARAMGISVPEIRARVLLMSGFRMNEALVAALDTLERELPHVERVRIRGANHLGPTNSGRPKLVAVRLADFYSRGERPV
ncbi:alpha/beta fold hydrolase [Leucobacter sp. M11]|uniref:alpha/beta fold hydrolase n=1 Tax=Leucobacter sp. M11 TaxID=2993565 RepID=UPI002D80A018|nr:alpha/beta fold hydrolase [Leucobacter sp. M11]MEB4613739.1 alpha/beta fold hydrolase [Leucobacter sp. M11]